MQARHDSQLLQPRLASEREQDRASQGEIARAHERAIAKDTFRVEGPRDSRATRARAIVTCETRRAHQQQQG